MMRKFLIEKIRILKIKSNSLWQGFCERGHERMTVLLIPHDEKRIYTIRVSRFLVLFLVVLVSSIITTSAFAYLDNYSVNSRKDAYTTNYRKIKRDLEKYEEESSELISQMNEIYPEIEEVYQLAVGDRSKDGGFLLPPADHLHGDGNYHAMPHTVRELVKSRQELDAAGKELKEISSFLDTRISVLNKTPGIIPVHGTITSLYGWRQSPFGRGPDFHPGIDIATAKGTPVHATAPGVVLQAGWSGGYGKLVRIQHKYGYVSYYGHNSQLAVQAGDVVKRGDVIAYVGSTGLSTGNHCHYELRLGGQTVNPYQYMGRNW